MKAFIGLFALFSFSICCNAQNMGGHHHTTSGPASEAAATSEMQDWAKERLAKSPRHQEWVKVKNGTREVSSFVVYPEVKTKATAVVVIHEIYGMSDWVQSLTDQMAEEPVRCGPRIAMRLVRQFKHCRRIRSLPT